MAEALVKFFLQRLDSLLLQEIETFSGVKDQILQIKSRLDEIGRFTRYVDRNKGEGELVHSWVRELRETVHDADDCVDQFTIQLNSRDGSDQTVFIAHFESELRKIEVRLTQILDKKSQLDIPIGVDIEESEQSPFDSFELNYRNLPYYLRSCLMYCCIYPEEHEISKGRLVRLLLAEGLIIERPGDVMEDIAEENIDKLVGLGMLQEEIGYKIVFKVPSPYREFSLHEMKDENFFVACASPDSNIPLTTRCVSIHDVDKKIPPHLNNLRLPIRSLFLFGINDGSDAYWNSLETMFYGLKFLRVLDLEHIKFKSLPDEVGDLIHLRYLGLKYSDLNELPESLSRLRNLQTLDIRWCGRLSTLSSGLLNLVQLRHLQMFKSMGVRGIKVPVGIGRLRNLQSFTCLYAGGSIARELSSLTQLRKLGVMDVSEDHASELSASIMKMTGLLSLSLEAEGASRPEDLLPTLEPFSPPPFVRKLCLEGCLTDLPDWIGSMENLTKLRLGFSCLSENPTSVLQFLPNLKHLNLWQAYKARQIGREFCGAGGFPKLEVLIIASRNLVEWTELQEGALPSLKYLHLQCCSRLRTLPEGLQYVTMLQQLNLFPVHGDHARRLSFHGGVENYKIKHIPRIEFFYSLPNNPI